jgi:hypothetical protein
VLSACGIHVRMRFVQRRRSTPRADMAEAGRCPLLRGCHCCSVLCFICCSGHMSKNDRRTLISVAELDIFVIRWWGPTSCGLRLTVALCAVRPLVSLFGLMIAPLLMPTARMVLGGACLRILRGRGSARCSF